MGRSGITYEDVSKAAVAVQARGENVTAARVRSEVGDTGSMSTINKWLSQWRAESDARLPEAGEVPDELEKAFRGCLLDLWQTSQRLAQSDIEQIRKAAQTASEELRRDLSDACDAHDQLSTELDRLRAQMEVVIRERDQASHTATTLAAEKGELERQFAEVVGRLDGRLSDLARVVEALSSDREATIPAAATKVRPATKRGRPNKAIS